MTKDNWISVKTELPKEYGWYRIKTTIGEFNAAYSHTLGGKNVWVVPDSSIITHWQPLNLEATC